MLQQANKQTSNADVLSAQGILPKLPLVWLLWTMPRP